MSSPTAANQNRDPEQPKRDHRQEVTDSIISLLEQGVAPWQKPWNGIGIPMNPTTDKPYRGSNAVHLMATGLQRGFDDPRWMTYKQASENDWQVKKGEKGTRIEFWEVKDPSDEKSEPGQVSVDSAEKSERRFIHKIYTVFNAQQIEGIPPHAPKERAPFEAIEAGERILASSCAKISHDQADRCFYHRATDSIHLPPKEAFNDAPGYYGTALHELSHWTGHPSRLNRSTLNESYRFGDPAYAKEELRAELSSVFLAAETGIPHDPASHAAYVGSWIEALKKDKNEIFRAAHDASAAADFVLSLDRERANTPEKERQSQPERETSRFVARLEPGSGTVGVHDKRFGNDHHTPVDQATLSSGEGRRDRNGNRSELSESFQEARALAIKELGQEARTYVPQTHSGIYCGKIIGETDHHVVQRVSGQTAIAHLKRLVGETPEMNSNVNISYQADKARVRDVPERSRTAELTR
ncbi:MAG: ArdC family protein [Bryobacteraceae bacterium]